MKYYILYKITNRLNNKFYIGRHITNKLDDNYFGSGKALRRAIETDGIENFVFEPLIYLHNKSELIELEHCVVDKEFVLRDDTYNQMVGGEHWQSMPGKNNPFYGKTHDINLRNKWKRERKGRKLTTQWRAAISKAGKLKHKEDPTIRLKTAKVKVLNKKTHKVEKISKLDYINRTDDYILVSKLPFIRCVNTQTLQIRQFKLIPNGWIALLDATNDILLALHKKRSDTCKNKKSDHTGWKWYHNIEGKEIFCSPQAVPANFILGRKPTLNVGRKLSDKTKEKIRKANTGKKLSTEQKKHLRELMLGRQWWNNGIINTRSKECPGLEWKKGRI